MSRASSKAPIGSAADSAVSHPSPHDTPTLAAVEVKIATAPSLESIERPRLLEVEGISVSSAAAARVHDSTSATILESRSLEGASIARSAPEVSDVSARAAEAAREAEETSVDSDPSSLEGNDKSLIEATKSGDIYKVRLLLDSAVNVNEKNNDGYTPLISAAQEGHTEVVTMLLDRGASIDEKEEDGWTALHWASQEGHTEVVSLLLDRGASIDKKGNDGRTPLHFAAHNGHLDVLTLLLDRGANIHEKEKEGQTPLHIAAHNGHLDVVTLLLDRGSSINENGNDGQTPLHWAARNRHTEVVNLLLNKGSSINEKDTDGWTPLHFAALNGHSEIVTLLLDRGASIYEMQKDGRTALNIAVQSSHLDVVTLLLDRGASIDEKQKNGDTLLHFAAKNGHIHVVTLLLDRGARLDIKDKLGNSALDIALEKGLNEITYQLVKAGANIRLKNLEKILAIKEDLFGKFTADERANDWTKLFKQIFKIAIDSRDREFFETKSEELFEGLFLGSSTSSFSPDRQMMELSREFIDKMVKVSPVKAIDLAKSFGEDKKDYVGIFPKLASGILKLNMKVEDIDKYVVLYKAFEDSAVKLDFALLERSYKDLILVLRNIDPYFMDDEMGRKIEIYNNLRIEGDRAKVFAKEIVAAKDEFARELNNAKTKKDKSKAKADLLQKLAKFQELRESIEKDIVNQRIKISLSKDIEEKLSGIYDLLIKSGGYGAELIRI